VLHVEFARRQRHWSQEKLGQLTGITQAFVSLMELGRGMGIPTPAQLQRLSLELGLPPEILLKPVVVVLPEDASNEMAAQR
jgi:transcriptional regulator with XRE-family HTH domain